MHLKDGREWISEDLTDVYQGQLSRLQRGDLVDFGKYELPGTNGKNDVHVKMPITWLVLDRKGDNLLLLSKHSLFWCVFDGTASGRESSWKNSCVRQELNGEKYREYFLDEERALIKPTTLGGGCNPVYYTGSDYSVTDYLFLLTARDFSVYLLGYDIGERSMAQLGLREYAKATLLMADRAIDQQDMIEIYEMSHPWWLRMNGGSNHYVAVVTEDGRIDLTGVDSDTDEVGIRPAMWIRTRCAEDDDAPF